MAKFMNENAWPCLRCNTSYRYASGACVECGRQRYMAHSAKKRLPDMTTAHTVADMRGIPFTAGDTVAFAVLGNLNTPCMRYGIVSRMTPAGGETPQVRIAYDIHREDGTSVPRTVTRYPHEVVKIT